MNLSRQLKKEILRVQEKEITQRFIYEKLAAMAGNKKNAGMLREVAARERQQYEFWKRFSGREAKPRGIKVFIYVTMARALGLSFTLKLMENERHLAKASYARLKRIDHGVENIIKDGEKKEREILKLIEEEKLRYTDSIVLGLNDGLVELVGGLAGFTFALQDTKLIAVSGLIMGVAGSLSMAGSEYLSTTDKGDKSPAKASVYTGIAYITIVILLISPFLLLPNPFINLAITAAIAVLAIAVFNYYVSVAKEIPFRKRFLPMVSIGMGVAVFNFMLGLAIRIFFGINP